jgi:hypothetical protein
MCQLDSGNRDRSVVERLESLHRRTAVLDRAVILLNDIVEVLAAPYLRRQDSWVMLRRISLRSENSPAFHPASVHKYRHDAADGRKS